MRNLRSALGEAIHSGGLVFAFFLFFINVEPGVNILAHLGGLIFGLVAGYLIASRRKPKYEKKQFRYRQSNLPF